MKEVMIVAYCDGNHEGRTPSAVERTVTIDGSKPVVLDLCGECDKAILALLTLMEQGAVVPRREAQAAAKAPTPKKKKDKKSEKSDDEDHTCPDCGHKSPNRTALGQHLRNRHGKGFRDLRREAAPSKTVPVETPSEPEQPQPQVA